MGYIAEDRLSRVTNSTSIGSQYLLGYALCLYLNQRIFMTAYDTVSLV